MKAARCALRIVLLAAFPTACASDPGPAAVPEPAPEPAPIAEPVPPAATSEVPAKRRMPEFRPSGIKEEFDKWKSLVAEVRNTRVQEQREKAKAALDAFLAGFPGRWAGREVPAPEAYVYAVLLQACGLRAEAVDQARRWIAVAPEDSVNYANAHALLVTNLAQAGRFDEAEAEQRAAEDGAFQGKDEIRRGVAESLAVAMMRAGRLEAASRHLERLAFEGEGDIESAIYGVDCALRLGKAAEAARIADKAAAFFREGKVADRAKVLVRHAALVGMPAPSFAAAKWWKGKGRPPATEDLRGKVTAVFSWNMQKQWNQWFFKRTNDMLREFKSEPVQFVGVSRLARFDPTTMAVREDLSEEDELLFYDLWVEQYEVVYPLAIGGRDDDSLIDAWGAHVVPCFVIVGKDGVVSYVGTGKDEDRFAVFREEIRKALAR